MSNRIRKYFAFILALAMLLSIVPVSTLVALATEDTSESARMADEFEIDDGPLIFNIGGRESIPVSEILKATGQENVFAPYGQCQYDGLYDVYWRLYSASGSTIDYSDGLFPLKNVPVLRLDAKEQAACFAGDGSVLREKLDWFLRQNDCRNAVIAMDGEKDPSYIAVQRLAKAVVDGSDGVLSPGEPIMIVLRHDMAKVLGRQVRALLADKRPVISIDSIIVQQNDYIDMGRPLMDGMVIPVVVKTLIFG